jgi:hypothetical protein
MMLSGKPLPPRSTAAAKAFAHEKAARWGAVLVVASPTRVEGVELDLGGRFGHREVPQQAPPPLTHRFRLRLSISRREHCIGLATPHMFRRWKARF